MEAFKSIRARFVPLGDEDVQDPVERARAFARRRLAFLQLLDVRYMDIFGYHPVYTFPGYRSRIGAWLSVLLALGVALRMISSLGEFMNPTPLINENILLFQSDMDREFDLPRFGLVFKRTGWQPFYDPNYFTFQFEQGTAGRASNSSYVDLGNAPCSFVDPHGRIIEDEARCPPVGSHIIGNFFDSSFRFVRVRMLRCHNGTDADGRTQPGSCRTPQEIDRLIYEGTLTLGIAQDDLDADSVTPFQNLLTFKKQFIFNVHPTYDVFFTVRTVTQQPRAFFDSLSDDAHREFVIYEKMEASLTDFRSQRIGRWNQPDPNFVPQYAAFFMMLSQERIDQQRSFGSVFALIEAWGASVCAAFLSRRRLARQPHQLLAD